MKRVIKRKCLVSNELFDKREMVRVVRTPEREVIIDESKKANGRGAYIKLTKENVVKAKKQNVFKQALNIDIPEEIYTQLEELANE